MKMIENKVGNCINQLLLCRVKVGKKGLPVVCSTPPASSSNAERFRVLLSIRSAAPHLRGKLTKMMNCLNSNLTHRDGRGHGTLRSAPSSSLQRHMRLSDIRFIPCRLNGCINITNGLQRA